MDPTNYMLGEFISVLLGIIVGAIIVGVCWSFSDDIQKREASRPLDEAERQSEQRRKEAETRLIAAALLRGFKE